MTKIETYKTFKGEWVAKVKGTNKAVQRPTKEEAILVLKEVYNLSTQ